jgi:hypothetical protein
MEHLFNVVIYPDEQTGMKFTDREGLWYNGGVAMGTDNFNMLSPEFLGNGLDEALGGLVAHEFFHVIHLNMLPSTIWPNWQFHLEGSADFNARHSLGGDIRRDRFWMIQWTFNNYAHKYHIELDLEHISSNPNEELDVYYLGDLFYEFLFTNHGGYEKIRQFYINAFDYSIFDASYEEIDNGYIQYLKSLAGITDAKQVAEVSMKIFIESDNLVIQNAEYLQNADLEIFTLSGQKLLQKNISIYPNEKYSLFLPNSTKSKFLFVRLKSDNSLITKKLYRPGY